MLGYVVFIGCYRLAGALHGSSPWEAGILNFLSPIILRGTKKCVRKSWCTKVLTFYFKFVLLGKSVNESECS